MIPVPVTIMANEGGGCFYRIGVVNKNATKSRREEVSLLLYGSGMSRAKAEETTYRLRIASKPRPATVEMVRRLVMLLRTDRMESAGRTAFRTFRRA